MRPSHLAPHYHHLHDCGDGTAQCCRCPKREPIPAGVTPEATYRPGSCGPWWNAAREQAARVAALECHDEIPAANPAALTLYREPEPLYPPTLRADDVPYEARQP